MIIVDALKFEPEINKVEHGKKDMEAKRGVTSISIRPSWKPFSDMGVWAPLIAIISFLSPLAGADKLYT